MARIPTIVSESSAQHPGYSHMPSGTLDSSSGLASVGQGLLQGGSAVYQAERQAKEQQERKDAIEKERIREEVYKQEVARNRSKMLDRALQLETTPYEEGEAEHTTKWFEDQIKLSSDRFEAAGLPAQDSERLYHDLRDNMQGLYKEHIRRFDEHSVAVTTAESGIEMGKASDDISTFTSRGRNAEALWFATMRLRNAQSLSANLTSQAARTAHADALAKWAINQAENNVWTVEEKEQLFALAMEMNPDPSYNARFDEIRRRKTPVEWTGINSNITAERNVAARTGNIERLGAYFKGVASQMVAKNQRDELPELDRKAQVAVVQAELEYQLFNNVDTGPNPLRALLASLNDPDNALISSRFPQWKNFDEGQRAAVLDHIRSKAVEHERIMSQDPASIVVKHPGVAQSHVTALNMLDAPDSLLDPDTKGALTQLGEQVQALQSENFGFGDNTRPFPQDVVNKITDQFVQQSPAKQLAILENWTAGDPMPNGGYSNPILPHMMRQVAEEAAKRGISGISASLFLLSKGQVPGNTDVEELLSVTNKDAISKYAVTKDGAQEVATFRKAISEEGDTWRRGMDLGNKSDMIEPIFDSLAYAAMDYAKKNPGLDTRQVAKNIINKYIGRRMVYTEESVNGDAFGVQLSPLTLNWKQGQSTMDVRLGFLDTMTLNSPEGSFHGVDDLTEHFQHYIREFAGQPVAYFGEDFEGRPELAAAEESFSPLHFGRPLFTFLMGQEFGAPTRLIDAPFAPKVTSRLDLDRVYVPGLPPVEVIRDVEDIRKMAAADKRSAAEGSMSLSDYYEKVGGNRAALAELATKHGINVNFRISAEVARFAVLRMVQRLAAKEDETGTKLNLFIRGGALTMPDGTKIPDAQAPLKLQYRNGNSFEDVSLLKDDIVNSYGARTRAAKDAVNKISTGARNYQYPENVRKHHLYHGL